VELDPGEIISCTHALLEAYDLSFPTSPYTPLFGVHLPIQMAQNPQAYPARAESSEGQIMALKLDFGLTCAAFSRAEKRA